MGKKTINELDGILDAQQDDAVCAIEQNNATFKARVRPNPPTQVNVTSEAQLITKFGSNLEIPDGQNFTVFYDASFTQTLPFKIGLGSSLEVTAQVIGITVTYTGPGSLFQNFNSVNLINRLFLSNILFVGDTTNTFIDIQSSNRVTLSNIGINSFENLGDISANTTIEVSQVVGLFYDKGLRLRDASVIICRDLAAANSAPNTNPTFLSIIGGTSPTKIFLNTIEDVDLDTGDSLLFLDPNFPTNTSVVITESFMSDSGNFYQPGTDLEIINATQNGGDVQFTTGTFATGTITLVVPVNTDTVTVNGLTYTAIVVPKGGDNTKFNISGTLAAGATDLADSITNDTRVGTDVPSIDQGASSVGSVVTILAATPGALANNIGLTSINPTGIPISGPFLTGGAGIVDNNLTTGNKVSLRGFSIGSYNAVFTVTATTESTFDVTLTFVANVSGLMDVSIISSSTGTISPTTFTTNVAHNLEVGYPVVLSNFTGAGINDYNKTFIVSAKTTTTFDIDITDVNATDVGTLSAASLDQTSPVVTAALNPGQVDSKTQVESRNVTSPILVDLDTTNLFVDISVTTGPTAGDFIQDPTTELFTVDTTTGIITYNGEHDASILASFRLTLQKNTGGVEDYEVSLFENSTEITKTRTLFPDTPSGANNFLTKTYDGGILTISEGDTFTLKIRSTDGTPSDVNVTDRTILFTET